MTKRSKIIIIIAVVVALISSAVFIKVPKAVAIEQPAAAQQSIAESSTNGSIVIDKDYVYDKMLNTIDNFQSVKGAFIYNDYNKNIENQVEYKVKQGVNAKTYERLRISDGADFEALYEEENLNTFDNKNMTMKVSLAKNLQKAGIKDNVKEIKAKDRIITDAKGEKTCYYRQNTIYARYSKMSLFPQEITMGYLLDQNQWNIVKNDKYMNLDCIVIEGKLRDDNYSKKLNVKTFKMWVETNTGILLKYEGYSAAGKLSEKLETTDIKINVNINDNEFYKDKSQYKKF